MKKDKGKSEESEDKSTENEDEPIEEVEYYKMAFKRLEKEGKHTWNWAAFFFGYVWALYRKMYLYSFLAVILYYFLMKICSIVLIPLTTSGSVIGLELCNFLLAIILGIIWGRYGNALYYNVVKKRIKKGDHLLDKYRPTSFWGIWGSFPYIFMPIGDYLARRKFFKTHKLKNNSVTAETINAYLNPKKENNWCSRSAIIISWLTGFFFMVSTSWTVYTAYSVADSNTKQEMIKLVREYNKSGFDELVGKQLVKKYNSENSGTELSQADKEIGALMGLGYALGFKNLLGK